MRQRDMMRELVAKFGAREDVVVREYAKAEKAGLVPRTRNAHSRSPENYARALWRDAMKKGWLHVSPDRPTLRKR
jgi:hypothetical protein